MAPTTRFARRVFLVAGIYGLLVLLPQYFLEEQIGRDYPPAITHPEHFYGFIGVALTWQLVFLLIASDVRRYRPLMLVAVLEKLSFGIAALVLYVSGRVAVSVAGAGTVDLLLGLLFAFAYRTTSDKDGPFHSDRSPSSGAYQLNQ
jgi:hypothetical protein